MRFIVAEWGFSKTNQKEKQMSDDKLIKSEKRVAIATAKADIARAQCDLSIAIDELIDGDPLRDSARDVRVAELRLSLSQKRLALTKMRFDISNESTPPAVI